MRTIAAQLTGSASSGQSSDLSRIRYGPLHARLSVFLGSKVEIAEALESNTGAIHHEVLQRRLPERTRTNTVPRSLLRLPRAHRSPPRTSRQTSGHGRPKARPTTGPGLRKLLNAIWIKLYTVNHLSSGVSRHSPLARPVLHRAQS